jgi:hypothetical protein
MVLIGLVKTLVLGKDGQLLLCPARDVRQAVREKRLLEDRCELATLAFALLRYVSGVLQGKEHDHERNYEPRSLKWRLRSL